MKKGVLHPGLTYQEYEALPGARASQLQGYARSPMHARHEAEHPIDSRQFALGRALHAAVLEPELYNAVYVAPQRVSGAGSRAINKALSREAKERGQVRTGIVRTTRTDTGEVGERPIREEERQATLEEMAEGEPVPEPKRRITHSAKRGTVVESTSVS